MLAGVLSGAVLAGAVLAGSVLAAAVLVVLAVLAVAVLAVLRWCAGRRSDVWESAGWGTQRPPSFGRKANTLPKGEGRVLWGFTWGCAGRRRCTH